MGKHWKGGLIQVTSISALIKNGFLCPFKVFAPPPPDLSKVRVTGGEYNEQDLEKECDKQGLTANVVQTWQDKAQNRRTIVFAVNCSHAKHLYERFVEAGIACAYIDGTTP
jgi:superfamily II DNA or RNA helicase